MTDNSYDITLENLNDSKTLKISKRISKLEIFFTSKYGLKPKFFINVPGRVNLIGEHIDYCGYPVLPMAIEQSILLAVAPSTENFLELSNINEKYKMCKHRINDFEIELPANGVSPEWYSYFLCGVKGIFDEYPSLQKRGMFVSVCGNIPPAAGLSSSSALVSSATLATSLLNEITLDRKKLADISAKCERYIGTQGGGMDQAIAFLAIEGCAQYIEWDPLRTNSVHLPSNVYFVIANSLTKANKAATHDFNQRVIECRLGCKILAKQANLDWKDFNRLANLQNKLDYSMDEFELFAVKILKQDNYTKNDVINLLEISQSEFDNDLLTLNTKHLENFKIKQRTLHVIQEAQRVDRFRQVASNQGNFNELAILMRESHRSLNDLYECSHENLNKLVRISDEFGISARLTGAGWGGCIVAICDSVEKSSQYINHLKENYFCHLKDFSEKDIDDIIFVTSPQRGATVYLNSQ